MVGHMYFYACFDQCWFFFLGGGWRGGRGWFWIFDAFLYLNWCQSSFLVNQFLVKDDDFFYLCYCLKECLTALRTCNAPTLENHYIMTYQQLMCLDTLINCFARCLRWGARRMDVYMQLKSPGISSVVMLTGEKSFMFTKNSKILLNFQSAISPWYPIFLLFNPLQEI